MGKIKQITINQFNGGISKDLRSKDYRKFGLAKNFDIFTYPHKIEPQLDLEDKTTDVADSICKFLYNPQSVAGSPRIMGFGKNSSGYIEVFYWDGSNWASSSNNQSSSTTLVRMDADTGGVETNCLLEVLSDEDSIDFGYRLQSDATPNEGCIRVSGIRIYE